MTTYINEPRWVVYQIYAYASHACLKLPGGQWLSSIRFYLKHKVDTRPTCGGMLHVFAQFVEFDTNDYLPDGCED